MNTQLSAIQLFEGDFQSDGNWQPGPGAETKTDWYPQKGVQMEIFSVVLDVHASGTAQGPGAYARVKREDSREPDPGIFRVITGDEKDEAGHSPSTSPGGIQLVADNVELQTGLLLKETM